MAEDARAKPVFSTLNCSILNADGEQFTVSLITASTPAFCHETANSFIARLLTNLLPSSQYIGTGIEEECPPNSRKAIPFRTELFEGHALLLLRTDPLDPVYSTHFEGKKREMEVQIQGRFLREPDSNAEIFCGVEVYPWVFQLIFVLYHTFILRT